MGLVRPFALLPAVNTTFDGFDRPTNPLLNEVRGQARLLTEGIVEYPLGFRFRGNTISMVGIIPTDFGGTVCTVKELASGIVEIVAVLVGNGELHDSGSTDLHISHYSMGVLIDIGGGKACWSWIVASTVSSSPPLLAQFVRSLRKRHPPRILR